MQATALYGSTDRNEEQAIGTGFTMLKTDLAELTGYSVFQVTITGDPGSYSVEFTLHFPEGSKPTFDQAETIEVLA